MAKSRSRKKKSGAEDLIEGLVVVAFLIATLAIAFVVLVGAMALDGAAVGIDMLRRRERRGLRFTRGLWFRVRHRRAPVRVATIGELLMLSPTGFEEAIAQSLRDRGYSRVRRCGGAGDLGVDVTARDPNGLSIAVQCKRYAPGNLVGSREIQLFIGMIATERKADRGVYVTTSGYTEPARTLGQRHNINLIDGWSLARILGDAGVPSPQPSSGEALGPLEVA